MDNSPYQAKGNWSAKQFFNIYYAQRSITEQCFNYSTIPNEQLIGKARWLYTYWCMCFGYVKCHEAQSLFNYEYFFLICFVFYASIIQKCSKHSLLVVLSVASYSTRHRGDGFLTVGTAWEFSNIKKT